MNSDWDEIKRLAADFQKAQLTSTLLKLSERNCVEIVTLLMQKNLLDVVFTNDGKEYITPEHLQTEIQDELYLNGGRVNLVEISKTLNVDLSLIEDAAQNIATVNPNIHFMLGQLIDKSYIVHIAQEINEKLVLKGELTISDLTQMYDLPSEFLQSDVVEKNLGKIIRGRQDPSNPRVFFTQAYIQRCKAKIRGALAAITRPINVSVILQQIQIHERVFHTLIDEIIPAGQVTSKMATAQYIPYIYAKTQADWVNSFYRQNGFLEYESIMKLGITDPKQFIRKQFPNDEFLYLKSCAVGSKIIHLTVITSLNECSATKSYVDLSTILPSSMSDEDIEEMFTNIIHKNNLGVHTFVFLKNIVFSQQYLTELIQPCFELSSLRAKAAVEAGEYQQYLAEKQFTSRISSSASFDYDEGSKMDRRDERRKKASSGKAGGGNQGRETKTKSTKKHNRSSRVISSNNDSEEDGESKIESGAKQSTRTLQLVNINDIIRTINKKLDEEGLDHLTESIAELYISALNQYAVSKAQEFYGSTPQQNRRITHAAIQEKINLLLVDVRLYDKGLKLFPVDIQSQLVKYLLKSLGNDICNELITYLAHESNITLKNPNMNPEQRTKVIQELDEEYRPALFELNKALYKTIDDFVLATEEVMKTCSMIIKKPDKRKDRQLVTVHKEKLIQQLKETSDPALLLHLATLILFTTVSGCILHASGKFVSNVLAYIRPNMTQENNNLLMHYHDSVLKLLQSDMENTDTKTVYENLRQRQEEIKKLVITFERLGIVKVN